MRALILDDMSRAAINRVVIFAHENPITRARLTRAVENPSSEKAVGDDERYRVIVPMEYRCVYSVEDQPMGLSRHLSVSVPHKDHTPSPEALALLMRAFGFSVAFCDFILSVKSKRNVTAPESCFFYLEKVDFTALNVVEKIR